MALRDIKTRYVGTVAGFVWSIINPLMIILVYWFVFSVGFKVQLAEGVPFIIVFLCGFIPWVMFTETLTTSVGSINANAHLIKKMVFPTEILPVVSLVAAWMTHIIMLAILALLLLANNIPLSVYNFQFLYYFMGLSVLSLGFGWLFSALNVFFRDVTQIVSVVLNMWFWLTPIVWSSDILPQKYQLIIKLNPIYYIVEGYRSSFVHNVPFWHNYRLGIYFWIVCAIFFIAGAFTFRKLKPDFAEVL